MQATNKMQQIPFIDLSIDPFKSILHVSGDKLAYLQEQFLTVYLVTGRQQYGCVVPNVVYTYLLTYLLTYSMEQGRS